MHFITSVELKAPPGELWLKTSWGLVRGAQAGCWEYCYLPFKNNLDLPQQKWDTSFQGLPSTWDLFRFSLPWQIMSNVRQIILTSGRGVVGRKEGWKRKKGKEVALINPCQKSWFTQSGACLEAGHGHDFSRCWIRKLAGSRRTDWANSCILKHDATTLGPHQKLGQWLRRLTKKYRGTIAGNLLIHILKHQRPHFHRLF